MARRAQAVEQQPGRQRVQAEISGDLRGRDMPVANRAVTPLRTAATTTPDKAIPPQASAAGSDTTPGPQRQPFGRVGTLQRKFHLFSFIKFSDSIGTSYVVF